MWKSQIKKKKWFCAIATVTLLTVFGVVITFFIIENLVKAMIVNLIYLLTVFFIILVVRKYELEENANRDTLTGLYQKEKLNSEIFNRCNLKKLFVYVLIDLNDFKYINDTYNHEIGDRVLIEFASELNELQEGSHGEVTVYRTGGDEFALLIDDNFDIYLEKISKLCKRVSKEKKHLNMNSLTFNFSYGVVFSKEIYMRSEYECATSVVADRIKITADERMYYYKRLKKQKARI